MSDRKPCFNCNRSIDSIAKACPFCGWDQREPAPPRIEPSAPAEPVATTPSTRKFEIPAPVRGVAGIAGLLILVFIIGALVHLREPDDEMNTTSTINAPRAQEPPHHTQIDLVPAGRGVTPGQPITSAPVMPGNGSMANPYARDDATALPQTDYSQLARRTQTTEARRGPQLADPRSITGRLDGVPATPRTTHTPIVPIESGVGRTEPVAVYQPVPSIRVDGEATARLLLTVGADGRVKDIDVARDIPGDTARLIETVQEWRFRPATENGMPVASRFSVDITFHGNE